MSLVEIIILMLWWLWMMDVVGSHSYLDILWFTDFSCCFVNVSNQTTGAWTNSFCYDDLLLFFITIEGTILFQVGYTWHDFCWNALKMRDFFHIVGDRCLHKNQWACSTSPKHSDRYRQLSNKTGGSNILSLMTVMNRMATVKATRMKNQWDARTIDDPEKKNIPS